MPPPRKARINSGFTLAEVLITLGIIGVVASLTIPSLIEKHQKQQTVTQLKKAYSTLSQALSMSETDNGSMSDWYFPADNLSDENQTAFKEKYILPYIKTIGQYKNGLRIHPLAIHTIDGNAQLAPNWIYLADGTAYQMFFNTTYFWIFIDINGKKGPNKLGKDIFITEIYREKKLRFWGAKDRTKLINDNETGQYSCKKGTNEIYAGGYCGALIQQDGWEIAPDYPW